MIDNSRFSKPNDKYNIFNLKIDLSSGEDIGVFAHEYYHHLQNVTTIHGAERFNLFIQLIGHIARLGKKGIPLKLPLSKWQPDEQEIQKDLKNLLGHISMWDYLEKKTIFNDVFTEEDLGSIVSGPSHNEGGIIPCYVIEYQDELIGYPIGGFTLSESSAFSVEQLYSQNPIERNKLDPKYETFEYTLIPFLISKLSDFSSRDVFLTSLMACELIYSVSTPAMGFLYIYKSLFSQVGQLKNYKQFLRELSIEFKEIINENISLELEMIEETQLNSKDLGKELNSMINWQIKQIEKGLRMRKENPYFIFDKLTKEEDGIKWLINEFPPSIIQIKNQGLRNFEVNHYVLLDSLSKIVINLMYSPELIYEEFKKHCIVEEINSKSYKVNIKTDDSLTTNIMGYALRMLNLDNCIIEKL